MRQCEHSCKVHSCKLRAGVQRVALLDFDVHHGNGTQACVSATLPTETVCDFVHPLGSGRQTFPQLRPWRDLDDPAHILFARFGLG